MKEAKNYNHLHALILTVIIMPKKTPTKGNNKKEIKKKQRKAQIPIKKKEM